MDNIKNLEKPKTARKAGPGRPKGSTNDPNILQMRNIMRMAISRVGAAEGLVKFYKESAENRRTFWNLAGRMIPMEVTGAGGEPLKVELSWIDGRGIDKAQAIDVAVREVAALADLSHTQEAIDPPTHIDIDVAPQRQTD